MTVENNVFIGISPLPSGFQDTKNAAQNASKPDKVLARAQLASQTLQTFVTSEKRQRDTTKAQAEKKVAELKERLRMLEQMFRGSPEQLAKAAAQIARELKAAVQGLQGDADQGLSAGYDASGGPTGAPAAPQAADGAEAQSAPAATDPTANAGGDPTASASGKADDTFKNDLKTLIDRLKALMHGHKTGDGEAANDTGAMLDQIAQDFGSQSVSASLPPSLPGALVSVEA